MDIDDYVNESGVINDPYFQIWSEMMDKKDQEYQDKELESQFERLFNETEQQGKEPF